MQFFQMQQAMALQAQKAAAKERRADIARQDKIRAQERENLERQRKEDLERQDLLRAQEEDILDRQRKEDLERQEVECHTAQKKKKKRKLAITNFINQLGHFWRLDSNIESKSSNNTYII